MKIIKENTIKNEFIYEDSRSYRFIIAVNGNQVPSWTGLNEHLISKFQKHYAYAGWGKHGK
jgi:hypothetical protein